MKLNRKNLAAAQYGVGASASCAPERMVHMGLGAFFRAHQAWYTQLADPANEWGFVAFTGRSATAALELAAQDGLYTLITRGAEGDLFEVVSSVVRAEDGNNLELFTAAVANPQTALVTLTITEAGYALNPDGSLYEGQAQLAALLAGAPNTALGRLAWALNQRRIEGAGAIALVPCDNIPANGHLLKGAMEQLMLVFGTTATAWLASNVSFVSTSIDRITPKTTDADIATVADANFAGSHGWEDSAPVVTEPFHDWVLQGDFPAGRPAWEKVGAKFVDEIAPFENRKLWLLNGSHSLLAYLGQLLGHTTVAQAIADPRCLAAVENFWDEAQCTLASEFLEVPEYRAALLGRFSNPRIAHKLAQIAIDGATKVRVRIVPTAKAELAAGRSASGAGLAIAAWVGYSIRENLGDTQGEEATPAQLVALLDAELAANQGFMDLVQANLAVLASSPAGHQQNLSIIQNNN